MKSYLALTLAILSTLTSCFSPKPVLRFKADAEKTTWDKGKEYVSYKKDSYEVHTSYFGNNDQYIMFDIEIINNDGEEFLVAPENIKLYNGNWDNKTQNTSYSAYPTRAIDPERELLKIDLETSRAEAASKNAGIAGIAIFAAAIPLAVIAARSDVENANSNSNESKISNTEMVGAGLDIALSANAINQEVQEGRIISMNDSRYAWETSSLRRTTLSPGYSIRGLVFFPIPDKNNRKIRIDVPLPSGIIEIKYDYLIYHVQNNQSPSY